MALISRYTDLTAFTGTCFVLCNLSNACVYQLDSMTVSTYYNQHGSNLNWRYNGCRVFDCILLKQLLFETGLTAEN